MVDFHRSAIGNGDNMTAETDADILSRMQACTSLEALRELQTTVAAFYHDAYDKWQVCADGKRSTLNDCFYVGWGDTLGEAIANLRPRES